MFRTIPSRCIARYTTLTIYLFGEAGSRLPGGSRCGAKGKVQVCRQVKLLPAPQLLPESAGLDARSEPVDGPAHKRDDPKTTPEIVWPLREVV